MSSTPHAVTRIASQPPAEITSEKNTEPMIAVISTSVFCSIVPTAFVGTFWEGKRDMWEVGNEFALLNKALAPVAQSGAAVELAFPYVPGLLSFRELPIVAVAWQRLTVRPDVLIFDGQGTAHPRRMGIACHGGLLFDIPSVGCATTCGARGP